MNAQKLYQVVRNGKIKEGDLLLSYKEADLANSLFVLVLLLWLIRVRRWRICMWDEAPATTRFVFVRSADGNTLFGFEGSL